MKDKNAQRRSTESAAMVEDGATEKLKKRASDLGLIVNAGSEKATKPKDQKKPGKK